MYLIFIKIHVKCKIQIEKIDFISKSNAIYFISKFLIGNYFSRISPLNLAIENLIKIGFFSAHILPIINTNAKVPGYGC